MMQRGNRRRLETALATHRAGTSNRDGTQLPAPTAWEARIAGSPQWSDLRLAVAVLRELGATPLVITIPLPGFFDDNTAFSRPVRSGYYDRWERTVERTAVPWLDFRDDDEDPFFVTDTGGHLSPRGWIFADRALDMFWHDQSLADIRSALATLAEHVPPPVVLAGRANEADGVTR
jgi:hypothetical protein